MHVSYITENFQEWDAYVHAHEAGSLYHTSAWKKIIERHFKKETFYIAAGEQDKIVGVLPLVHFKSALFGNFIVSVPYVNYGGILADSREAMEALTAEAETIRERCGADFVELRDIRPLETHLPVKTQKVTFFLDLPESPDDLMASFKAKLRSQIRRPVKEGITGEVGGMEFLDDFYEVFCRNMRDLGTPVYSKHFFRTILEETPENSHIALVRSKEGKTIGAAFLHGYKQRMEIPWASTLREYNRFSPNMLMYWEVLRFSIEKGYKQFDFGRCSRDSGTYRFKKQWGSVEQQLYWYYVLPSGGELPQINPDNPKYKLAISMWQKMPLAFTRLLGPSIVKNLP
ncbi:MAG TPA: FemAB family PEP-CTERM system-associated protein [Caldithrix abyssi]|uniref:FemAB family PEP-CTERM system-associated protein n=1 Tax=Caldithrix abyssi TaxID=187145 RepID=A0A7V1LM35_CALAY|nr:FemAB family PEP-CTERM system-associated protein [Caldithrix abyssi]